MLCKYCENFDYDQLISPERYRHHQSWDDLLASGEEGCRICGLVIKLFNESSNDEPEKDASPITCELRLNKLGDAIIFWSEDFKRAKLQPFVKIGKFSLATLTHG